MHADTPDIDVIFVKEQDDIVNPLGTKGLGERHYRRERSCANAVYHTPGKRVRRFPITPDKLL